MSTPHINAEKGDFAKTVLMPGDPYRAEFIAKNFLDDARLVNDVRAVRGYTGTYKGKPVSVSISVSTFVPKPFTPFQFEPQISKEETERRQYYLRN